VTRTVAGQVRRRRGVWVGRQSVDGAARASGAGVWTLASFADQGRHKEESQRGTKKAKTPPPARPSTTGIPARPGRRSGAEGLGFALQMGYRRAGHAAGWPAPETVRLTGGRLGESLLSAATACLHTVVGGASGGASGAGSKPTGVLPGNGARAGVFGLTRRPEGASGGAQGVWISVVREAKSATLGGSGKGGSARSAATNGPRPKPVAGAVGDRSGGGMGSRRDG